ncbi:FKBP-type peptidyl-prolyl cis-trans isomerase [Leifsonia poae]|uniref:FKBP-type peptidyl-prolyl cis-trans isomerase n=1 Tax=Leifsonia poae TaxID=110933 RepID=UPI0022F2512D|nr:FKBP-type peptidyl-prolyl cis-trans isomerase [Leifsonia poae]
MRKTLSILAAGLVVAGLAACSSGSPTASSSPSASAASTACINVKEGDASKAVTVSGAFGATPKVTIKTPLKASSLERSVAITGDGSEVKGGDSVDIAIAAYNGTTGKELIPATGFGGTGAQAIPVDATKYAPGLVRAVECLPLKSRVVIAGSAKEMFGAADISQLSIKATDPVVFVVDSIDKAPTRADGTPVAPKAGFPTVTLSKTGEPTITIPKADPPTTTQIAVLKQGDGEVVQSGDTVTVQYKGVLWRNGQMFDSSWSRGAPTPLQTTGVVKGFQKALEGQKVGTQVIAVIPPADGYGKTGQGDIKATDTMVFVIDILKTTR